MVEASYGDNDRIKSEIARAFKAMQKELGDDFQKDIRDQVAALEERIQESLKRLVDDIQRVKFQLKVEYSGASLSGAYRGKDIEMGLSPGDYGQIAFSLLSYTAAGFGIGSAFPVVGNVVGAIAGFAVGVLMSIIGRLTSKEKKIRKAQAKIQESIDDIRRDVFSGLDKEVSEIVSPIKREIEQKVYRQVDDLNSQLTRPIEIIKGQMSLMENLKARLEKMPYGTIQEI